MLQIAWGSEEGTGLVRSELLLHLGTCWKISLVLVEYSPEWGGPGEPEGRGLEGRGGGGAGSDPGVRGGAGRGLKKGGLTEKTGLARGWRTQEGEGQPSGSNGCDAG